MQTTSLKSGPNFICIACAASASSFFNTEVFYVMYKFYFNSLTLSARELSLYVRIWRVKTVPALKFYIKKPFGLHGLDKNISAL